jgi:hypothetical protein
MVTRADIRVWIPSFDVEGGVAWFRVHWVSGGVEGEVRRRFQDFDDLDTKVKRLVTSPARPIAYTAHLAGGSWAKSSGAITAATTYIHHSLRFPRSI